MSTLSSNLRALAESPLYGGLVEGTILASVPALCAEIEALEAAMEDTEDKEAMLAVIAKMNTDIARLKDENAYLRRGMAKDNDDICQTLGKVLGYPWYKDDQANFPGATDENGVCVGEHVAATMAEVAAKEIVRLKAEVEKLREALRPFAKHADLWGDFFGNGVGVTTNQATPARPTAFMVGDLRRAAEAMKGKA